MRDEFYNPGSHLEGGAAVPVKTPSAYDAALALLERLPEGNAQTIALEPLMRAIPGATRETIWQAGTLIAKASITFPIEETLHYNAMQDRLSGNMSAKASERVKEVLTFARDFLEKSRWEIDEPNADMRAMKVYDGADFTEIPDANPAYRTRIPLAGGAAGRLHLALGPQKTSEKGDRIALALGMLLSQPPCHFRFTNEGPHIEAETTAFGSAHICHLFGVDAIRGVSPQREF